MRNREIRFRAWHSTKNEWLHDTEHACNILGEMILLGGWCNVPLEELNDVIVMQFTGLLDKNGVEIYEGDIVRVTYQDEDDRGDITIHLAVGFNPTCAAFDLFENGTPTETMDSVGETEIIGNIYQNPELVSINQ